MRMIQDLHTEHSQLGSRKLTDAAKTFVLQTITTVMKCLNECCDDDVNFFVK